MPALPGSDAGRLARLQRVAQFQRYALGSGFDEMFDAGGSTRAHYAALCDRLEAVDPQELRQRQSAADLAFLHQGITFTVYGEREGTERIFPYDLIPAHPDRRRVAGDRARPDAAHHRPQPVPQGPLPRRPGARRPHRSARADLHLQALPPRDAGRGGAARHLRLGRRDRPGAAAGWRRSRCSRTTCACRAASATCSPTGW